MQKMWKKQKHKSEQKDVFDELKKSTIKKEEPKKESVEKIISNNKNPKMEEFLNYMQEIRIDNTLSKFNKKKMLEIKKQFEDNLNDLLMNPDYSQYASIILDGTLKATSDENIIFVYKTPAIATSFNEKIIPIQNTVEEVLNKRYKVIATDEKNWEKIKDEFNNKKRKFIYKEEDFNVEDVFKTEDDDIVSMFEDIIEYNQKEGMKNEYASNAKTSTKITKRYVKSEG